MIHSLADGSLDAGCNGELPKAGTEEAPLELFVANAGTAARFLSAARAVFFSVTFNVPKPQSRRQIGGI